MAKTRRQHPDNLHTHRFGEFVKHGRQKRCTHGQQKGEEKGMAKVLEKIEEGEKGVVFLRKRFAMANGFHILCALLQWN